MGGGGKAVRLGEENRRVARPFGTDGDPSTAERLATRQMDRYHTSPA